MRVLRVFGENRKFTIRVCYRVWYMLLVLVLLMYVYNIKERANKSFFYFLAKMNHKRTIPPFYVCAYTLFRKNAFTSKMRNRISLLKYSTSLSRCLIAKMRERLEKWKNWGW